MTRKRFVRLVMAARIDRNNANKLADDVKRRGIPYAVAHRMISGALLFIELLGDKASAVIEFVDREPEA